jgi:hypothetical protein
MLGPFHRYHQGIYPIYQNNQVYPETLQPISDISIKPAITSFFGKLFFFFLLDVIPIRIAIFLVR